MPQLKLIPKVKRTTKLPEDLRKFLATVSEQIEAGDESTLIPSDDLLQCRCAYGGLAKKGMPWFTFVFFPGPSTHPKWTLRLHVEEIKKIADGTIEDLVLWACKNKACGNQFFDQEDTCGYCDYLNDDGTPRELPMKQELEHGKQAGFSITWIDPKHPNSKIVIELPSSRDIEPRLRELSASFKERTLISISSSAGAFAMLGLGGSPSIVLLGPIRGSTLISLGEANAIGKIGFSKGEDWKELPARNGIPEDQAIKAVIEYLASGRPMESLNWEKAPTSKA
jgi:hypothetical protein